MMSYLSAVLESSSLLEIGLFLITCLLVFLYASISSAQPKSRHGTSNCAKSQDCVKLIHQLCQNRSTQHKGLAMYLDHKDHINKDYVSIDWESFFYHLLIAVSRVGTPQLSSTLFAHRRELGIPPSINLYEVAMKMLAGKRLYEEALQVYDESLKDRLTLSPVSYSCLINFAIEVDQTSRAIAFFERLSELTTPSIRAYMSILRLYSKKRAWKESIKILRHMQERGVALDSLVLNIVLGTCIRADEIEAASNLLMEFKSIRDVISFNNVLKGFAHSHQYLEAIDMLEQMRELNVAPTMVTYNTVMDACVRSRKYDLAWEVAATLDQPADKYTVSILVKTLANMSSKIPNLLDFLETLEVEDAQSSLPLIFTTIVDALSERPDLRSFQRVQREASKRALLLSFPCLILLLRGLWSLGDDETAYKVWTELSAGRMPPVVFFQLTLDLTIQVRKNGNPTPYESLCRWLKEERSKVTDAEKIDGYIQLVIKAHLKQRNINEAMDLYCNVMECMRKSKTKVHFDVGFFSQLIKVQVQHHRLGVALRILEDLRSCGMQPERLSLVCIFQSCLRQLDVAGVNQALQAMELMGVRPSEQALMLVLRLYLKCDRWDETINMLFRMENNYGILPQVGTCTFVMQALVKARQGEKTLQVFNWMKNIMYDQLDASTYNIALQACACQYYMYRGTEIAREALTRGLSPAEGLGSGLVEFLNTLGRRGDSSGTYSIMYKLLTEHNIVIPASFPPPGEDHRRGASMKH